MADTKTLRPATAAKRNGRKDRGGHRTTWLWDDNRGTTWKTLGIMIAVVAVMSALTILMPPRTTMDQRMLAKVLVLGIPAAIDAVGTTYGGDESRLSIFIVTVASIVWFWPSSRPDDAWSWGALVLMILAIALWIGYSFTGSDEEAASTPVTLGVVIGILLCVFRPEWAMPAVETATPYVISLLLAIGVICSLRRTDDRNGDCSLVTSILIQDFGDFHRRHATTIFAVVVTVRLLLCVAAASLMIRLYVFPELAILMNTLVPSKLLPYL